MLILSKAHSQEVFFPRLGIRIDVEHVQNHLVCLGIDAPKEFSGLQGSLENQTSESGLGHTATSRSHHALRNRLNAMSLCLYVMKEKREANIPIEPKIVTRALQELNTMEHISSCASKPNPFMDRLSSGLASPFVLIVDDAPDQAEPLADHLRQVGIQVALTSDGEAALHLLESIDRLPGILLLDVDSQGTGSQSTLQAVRDNPAYEGTKVFAVTAMAQEALTAGAGYRVDRWFRKPIMPDQLVEQIQLDLSATV